MKRFFVSRFSNRIVAATLVVAILLGLCFDFFGPPLSVMSISEKPYIVLDGERVESVKLENDAKLRFEAVSQTQSASYQWQIRDPEDPERWINIADGLSRYLWVTYALVGSMVDALETVRLRCCMKIDGELVYTDPVSVTVSWNVFSDAPAPVYNSRNDTVRTFKNARAADVLKTYTIVINYIFDNNTMAFEPYGASVAAGSNFKASITCPVVVGYDPFRKVGEDYVDASVVEFDLTNIQENITINVVYEPAMVTYSIHHHLQHILDDDYSVNYDLITIGKALTGSVVGDGLALTEEQLPGFKP